MRTIALAASIAIACGPLTWQQANAADFSHAKRTFVPASAYDRRVDATTMHDYQAPGTSAATPVMKASASKYSVVPKTSGSTAKSVPAPPSSMGISQAQLAAAGKYAQAQAKKALANPQVQAAIATMRKRAIEYVASGKFEEAKHMAARVLQVMPQDKTLLRAMAVSSLDNAKKFVQSNNFDQALSFGREALAYDTTNIDAKKTVDALLMKAGVNPNDAAQRVKDGDLLLAQGKTDEAFVEYQQSLKLKPSADAHVGIGNVALRAGQNERAKTEFHAAIDVDSNSSSAYRQLGLLKLGQGDVVGANAALSRALVLNPKDAVASKSLTDLWQQQVSKVPGANSHLGLARAYQLAGDLRSAQAEYRTVVQMDPANPHLVAARQSFKLAMARQEAERSVEAGRQLEANGAISEAFNKVHDAVRMSPGDADLRVYEGQLLEKMNQPMSAREAYINALKINPKNSIAGQRLAALPQSAAAAQDLALLPGDNWTRGAGLSGLNGGANGGAGLSSGAAAAANGTGFTPYQLQDGAPVPTHDPVANLSSFAMALRNHMATSKTALESHEDLAHGLFKSIGGGGSSADALGAGAAGLGGSALSSTATMGGIGSDPLADSSAAIDPNLGSSVGDAISRAQAAIAKAKGKSPSLPGALAPSVVASNPSASSLNALRAQNSQLQSQVSTANSSMVNLNADSVPANPDLDNILGNNIVAFQPPPPMTDVNSGGGAIGFEPPVAPSISQSMAATNSSTMAFLPNPTPGLKSELPVVDPSAYSSPQTSGGPGIDTLKQPLAVPNLVRLELENAAPKLGAVELSVLLRNDGDTALPLSSNKMKAIINYSNRRPVEVKAMFNDPSVPPHSSIRGMIRVPFDKVDPTADLVIPGLLPPTAAVRDVHLITSMASRIQ